MTTSSEGHVTRMSCRAQRRTWDTGKNSSKHTLEQPGWRVSQSKSLWSSLHTRSAVTRYTSTRKMKTRDSQTRPKAVEYLLAPLRSPSKIPQFMVAPGVGGYCGERMMVISHV
ncbi:TPA: hypothetical protein BOS_3795 [Bos taurus]|nr:TPA: hypothetical protein BOS_3795 [Bos taurus]